MRLPIATDRPEKAQNTLDPYTNTKLFKKSFDYNVYKFRHCITLFPKNTIAVSSVCVCLWRAYLIKTEHETI